MTTRNLRGGLIPGDAGAMARALALALLASACASAQGAPINYGRGSAPQAAPTSSHPHAATQGADWADGPGTPLSAYALQPDDAHPYDPANMPRTHRVGRNESLYDIASSYQLPLRALIDQNHLEPPYALAPGRVLQLPPPRLHRVERGETLESIARDYNVDLRSLALLNRMEAPYAVQPGDQVALPAMARELGALGPPASSPAIVPPPSRARQVQAPLPARTPAVQEQPSAPPPSNVHFAWPVRGEVLARFGLQPGGARLDGVEIAAAEGASVSAAGDGEVVYAGSDLNAYGTLVLVRHENGYVTAYGYARRALVREGQRVRSGQAIAEVGRVKSGETRLLFQVRRGRDAIDPLPLLGN